MRRAGGTYSKYNYQDNIHLSYIKSSFSGKNLKLKDWIKILCNPQINNYRSTRFDSKKGIYLDISLERFVECFQDFVAVSPVDITNYLCDENNVIPQTIFIDAYFRGVSCSKISINEESFEKVIRRFGYDYESERAADIARIIEKMDTIKNKIFFADILWDIIENHNETSRNEQIYNSSYENEEKSSESILFRAMNCVRGNAIHAIASMICDDKNIFENYKTKIEAVASNMDPVIRCASLDMLLEIYNYDKRWAMKHILKVFESDIRLVAYRHSRTIFCKCYDDYPRRIKKLIMKALGSSDECLKKIASYTVTELFMLNIAFKNLYKLYIKADVKQKGYMLEMVMIYLEIENYKKKAKSLLEKIIVKDNDIDNNLIWAKLFMEKLVNTEDDKELIVKVLRSKHKKNVMFAFADFVIEERTAMEYSNVILEVCYSFIENQNEIKNIWEVSDDIIKLIFYLYDETANSSIEEEKLIANNCFDLWDKMYENNISIACSLTDKFTAS